MANVELVKWHIERDAGMGGQSGKHRTGKRVVQGGPQVERSPGQGSRRIANQHREICALFAAQAFARWAPPEPAIKGKAVRREGLKTAAALVASEVLTVNLRLPFALRKFVVNKGQAN